MPLIYPADPRRILGNELRERARVAQRVYRSSLAAARQQIQPSKALDWESPDGAQAFRSALRHERSSLARYRRELQVYMDFLLHGRIPSLQHLLEPVLDMVLEKTGAEMGNVQVLDPVDGALTIQAQIGFSPPFLEFFARVHEARGSSCGAALVEHRRVIVPDVRTSPIFVGTPSLRVLLDAGVHAVQSTPLIDPSGQLIGMFSTHSSTPTLLLRSEFDLIDEAARRAAALIGAARRG